MNKKYLVCDERKTEFFVDVYDDPEEAALSAQAEWDHLTAREQSARHIYSVVVTLDDLSKDAIDEDDNIDWTAFESCDTYEGCFDSDHAREFELHWNMTGFRAMHHSVAENTNEIIHEANKMIDEFIKARNLDIENDKDDMERASDFSTELHRYFSEHGKLPCSIYEEGFDSLCANASKLHWDMAGFRAIHDFVPENANDIIRKANKMIDNFIETHNLDIESNEDDMDQADDFSTELHIYFSVHGKLPTPNA